MPAGGSRMPASAETVSQRLHYVHQDGQQVFKYAVRKMYEIMPRICWTRNGLTSADVGVLHPPPGEPAHHHGGGGPAGTPVRQVMINIERYGNTTAATIPLATRDAIEQGRLKKGDIVVFAAVGAGYTVGASLWRWAW